MVEDPDVGKLRTIDQEAVDLTRGHNFDCKVFWDSNPELSCLKLTLDYVGVKFSRLMWEECGPIPVFACYTLIFALQVRK